MKDNIPPTNTAASYPFKILKLIFRRLSSLVCDELLTSPAGPRAREQNVREKRSSATRWRELVYFHILGCFFFLQRSRRTVFLYFVSPCTKIQSGDPLLFSEPALHANSSPVRTA